MKNLAKTNEYFYEFARFRLVPAERLLLSGEVPLQLPPKVFDTLLVLVENGGRLIEKDELLEKIWADTFVEEATLARNISILRKVLGENGSDQKFIETVPKRGYRFIEPVRRVTAEKKSAAPVSALEPASLEPNENLAPLKTRRPVLWLMLAFVIVSGLFASLSFWKAKPENSAKIKSIAVLPFKPIGVAERDESLELGMADAVITRLGKIRQIVVRPTSTVSKYLEIETDAIKAGKDLQTEAVLEGTIQRQNDRLRVTARLVRTEDGSQLWAETFDERFTDIFSVQDSISLQIAQSLDFKLSEGEKRSLSAYETENPAAYDLYRQGRYFWNKRTPEGLLKAIENFERAKETDPNYAQAYAGLADCYVLLGEYRLMPPNEAFSKARIAAHKALEINAELAEARSAKAYILGFYDWDWDGAEKEFKKAIEQNPNYATAHHWYAEFLQVLGRFDESLAHYRRAEELDPFSLIVKSGIAGHFYLTRQYDKSIEQSRKIIEMDSNFGWAYAFLWLSYKEKGLLQEAFEAHIKAQIFSGVSEQETNAQRKAFARSGWKGYWLKIFEQLNTPARRKQAQAVDFAAIYAEIGDKENGIKSLQRSYEARERWLLNIKFAPQFDPLRDDPRFAALLDQIGLNSGDAK